MKNLRCICGLFLLLTGTSFSETPIDLFIHKYHDPIYQDIVIENQIYPIGSDYCEPRYELMKPILDLYKGNFSLLDLGAAQGYFSFRTAQEYPLSSCLMIESNNTSYYAHHGDMLFDLCLFNAHLKNIYYLNRRVDLNDLSYLNENEHFDVIIAFLVVHLMEDNLKKQIEVLKILLNLGDNLILEVANDVGVTHTNYVEFLGDHLNAEFLGEVKRHKDPNSTSTGKMFWFKSKNSCQYDKQDPLFKAIQKKTFMKLNGVYPLDY